jgi:hypothetical protein
MFTLSIDTSNAAFRRRQGGPTQEIARILRVAILLLESGIDESNLQDINGMTVGRFLSTSEK